MLGAFSQKDHNMKTDLKVCQPRFPFVFLIRCDFKRTGDSSKAAELEGRWSLGGDFRCTNGPSRPQVARACPQTANPGWASGSSGRAPT